MPIRVLIVDDHPFVRAALTDLLSANDDIDVVGQCVDGSEATAAVERTRPDVVLMDLKMPRMDGLTATRQVLADHPRVRIIILTCAPSVATSGEAWGAGAAGYLLKDDDPGVLLAHIRAVAAGEEATLGP